MNIFLGIRNCPIEVVIKCLCRSFLFILFRLSLIREKRRDVLGNVFKSIDERIDGKLNRHRIVQLFTAFYEHADNSTQHTLVDPKTFGISEFEQDIINESLANYLADNLGNSMFQ